MQTTQFIKHIKDFVYSPCLVWIVALAEREALSVPIGSLKKEQHAKAYTSFKIQLIYELHKHHVSAEEGLISGLAGLNLLIKKLPVPNSLSSHFQLLFQSLKILACLNMEGTACPDELDPTTYAALARTAVVKHQSHVNTIIAGQQDKLSDPQMARIAQAKKQITRYLCLSNMLNAYDKQLASLKLESEEVESSIGPQLALMKEAVTLAKIPNIEKSNVIDVAVLAIKQIELKPWEQKCLSSILPSSVFAPLGSLASYLIYPLSGMWSSAASMAAPSEVPAPIDDSVADEGDVAADEELEVQLYAL